MKRIITLLLLTALTLTLFFTFPAAAAEGSAEVSAEMTELLTSLGIIRSYVPDSDVALSDMTAALTTITGSASAIETYFDANRIKANRALKYSEVLAVLVDLCGYTPYLELRYSGMNQNSYIRLANEIGITDGVTVRYDETITSGDWLTMLYNTLFTDVLIQTAYGENARFRTGENVLARYMNLYMQQDVITAAGSLALHTDGWDYTPDAVRQVEIGGTVYTCTFDFDEQALIGRRVQAYTDMDDNIIRAIVIPERLNKTLELDGDDMLACPDTQTQQFSYVGSTARRTSGQLSKTADVICGGELLIDFSQSDFTDGNPSLTFIDNDVNGQYDVVLIEDYLSFIIQNVSDDGKKIMDTESDIHDFTEFVESGRSFIDRDGAALTASELRQGSVLSYARSGSGAITRAIVFDGRQRGVFSTSREGNRYITVGDTEYECDSRFYQSTDVFRTVLPGSDVTLWLDFRGRVVYLEAYENVLEYGWIFNMAHNGGFENTQFLMLDENAVYAPVMTVDKPAFNGTRIESRALMSAPEFYNTRGQFVQQLIRFRRNSEGFITQIETAVSDLRLGAVPEDPAVFTLNYDASSQGTLRVLVSGGMRWLATKYVADATVPLFIINQVDEERSTVQTAQSLTSGSIYNLRVYNIDQNYKPGVMAMILSDSGENAGIDRYMRSYLLLDRTQELDADTGEPVTRLQLYSWSSETEQIIEYTVPDPGIKSYSYNTASGDSRLSGIPLRDVPRGSQIQIRNYNGTNDVYAYSLQFMPMADNSELIFEAGDTNMSWNYGLSETVFNGNGLYSYGPVLAKTAYGIITNYHEPDAAEYPVMSWNRHIPFTDSTQVVFWDKADGSYFVGNWKDIEVGDMIYMQRQGTSFTNVTVYR